ncbi:protocadherin beta-15-like isoform X1 [Pecten maximus]|uniref:protocadherin beta-15-like isoform X1 n=1 Tax=Pecten maximus TaxID=6579 RepID=UPI00145800CD|nr:protocadherin beta-15-like isoform X1 [Pecten maximus]XP_033743646.1 protocadherin beta-15-like isoform X1 [Pecten maximus]
MDRRSPLVLMLVLTVTSCFEIMYNIEEEQDKDFYLGKVASDAQLITGNGTNIELRYSLLTTGNPDALLFHINERTSALYTASVLDRDTLCPFTSSDCILRLDVTAISPINDFFEKIKVHVRLLDINDNVPVFPESNIDMEISENSGQGKSFPLDGATDEDSGQNAVQSYRIETSNVPFILETTDFADGRALLRLVVDEELDRETQNKYIVKITAIDGGAEPKTGTVTLNITITDANDNPPKFPKAVYNRTIPEDIVPNSVFLTFNATDPDENENGRVLYRLSSHQSEEIRRLFKVGPTTGELSVISSLIDERTTSYRIIVEASDNATQPLISQAQVYVTVLDTHNNAPEITVNVLSQSYYAEVSESAAIGTVLAIISVKDPDNGQNGVVTCSIDDDNFRLVADGPDEYNFVLRRILDREMVEWHTVVIECRDYGTPRLNTSSRILVRVLDINDNPPQFTKAIYYVNVPENDAANSGILQVQATDSDSIVPSSYNYSLTLPEEYKNFFRINANSGVITAVVSLDREATPRITFQVSAEDGGSPSLTGSALVEVNVIDKNDNPPRFTPTSFEFVIPENQLPNVSVGKLVAQDGDAGDNGEVSFSLTSSADIYLPFDVLKNGTILGTRTLDRELIAQYNFTVIAYDHGSSPLTSTAEVTIIIQDINDNAPIITFPSIGGDLLYLSSDTLPNTVIATIKAYDNDDDVNAKLSYFAQNSNMTKLFTVNKFTGQLSLSRHASLSDIGTYDLSILVQDGGKPPRSRFRTLTIIITDSSRNPSEDPSAKIKYFAIAIAISCVTIVLSILIILAICLIRRKDRQRDSKYPESVSTNSTIDTVPEQNNPDIKVNGIYTRETIHKSLTDTLPRNNDTFARTDNSPRPLATLERIKKTKSPSRTQPEIISDSVAIWDWSEQEPPVDGMGGIIRQTRPSQPSYPSHIPQSFITLYPDQSSFEQTAEVV